MEPSRYHHLDYLSVSALSEPPVWAEENKDQQIGNKDALVFRFLISPSHSSLSFEREKRRRLPSGKVNALGAHLSALSPRLGGAFCLARFLRGPRSRLLSHRKGFG